MSDAGLRFRVGDPVIVRQITRGELGLIVREIGPGRIAETPEVGAPLRIELRRGRGLASSSITDVRPVGVGQLAVRTTGRIYLLSDFENRGGLGDEGVEELVSELFASGDATPGSGATVTEYVRMLPASDKEERRIRVMRVRDGVEELIGEGALLSEVEPGESLRFTSVDGRVLATSVVEMVSQRSPSTLEASTGNSTYRVEFLCGKLPGLQDV